jgi:hypothetical protein
LVCLAFDSSQYCATYLAMLLRELPDPPLGLLKPVPPDEMTCWPISRDVNRRGLELGASILEPIKPEAEAPGLAF